MAAEQREHEAIAAAEEREREQAAAAANAAVELIPQPPGQAGEVGKGGFCLYTAMGFMEGDKQGHVNYLDIRVSSPCYRHAIASHENLLICVPERLRQDAALFHAAGGGLTAEHVWAQQPPEQLIKVYKKVRNYPAAISLYSTMPTVRCERSFRT